MLTLEIHEDACRGCRICEEVCPTKALGFDEARARAVVREAEDCIACLSCTYGCPSGAIRQTGFHAVKNFYRELAYVERLERFL